MPEVGFQPGVLARLPSGGLQQHSVGESRVSIVRVYGHLSIPQCLRAIRYKPICAGIQRVTAAAVKNILCINCRYPEIYCTKPFEIL